MESMGLRACAARAFMTPPVNHNSTNASATLVSTDTVRIKSMGMDFISTRILVQDVQFVFIPRSI